MAEELSLRDLVDRVRSGDEQAATDLVRRVESALGRCLRVWMRDPRVRRRYDCSDVCQSVLVSFMLRLQLGQYELGSSEDVLKLLTVMARNKFLNLLERENAQKRDSRRDTGCTADDLGVADDGSSPSFQIILQELAEQARQRLAPDEQRLVELRNQERGWDEIGAELNLSPDAARKKHGRAVERVAKALGLD
jgi:RNA polymerase sigma-70 factor (ECF subfamily)